MGVGKGKIVSLAEAQRTPRRSRGSRFGRRRTTLVGFIEFVGEKRVTEAALRRCLGSLRGLWTAGKFPSGNVANEFLAPNSRRSPRLWFAFALLGVWALGGAKLSTFATALVQTDFFYELNELYEPYEPHEPYELNEPNRSMNSFYPTGTLSVKKASISSWRSFLIVSRANDA